MSAHCLNGLGIVAKEQGLPGDLKVEQRMKFAAKLSYEYPLAVVLLRNLIREFARVLRAIIHGADRMESESYLITLPLTPPVEGGESRSLADLF
jgi:hypothetical protein